MRIPLLYEDGYLIKRDKTWSLYKYNHFIRDLDKFESHFLSSVQSYYITRTNELEHQLDLLGGDE